MRWDIDEHDDSPHSGCAAVGIGGGLILIGLMLVATLMLSEVADWRVTMVLALGGGFVAWISCCGMSGGRQPRFSPA